MQRFNVIAPLLLGLLTVAVRPAWAEDDAGKDDAQKDMETARQAELRKIRSEIRRLNDQADALEQGRRVLLDHEIESYVQQGQTPPWLGAGPFLEGIAIEARLTAVGLATLNGDPGNRHAVAGDADIRFDFEVTDDLGLFIEIAADTGGNLPDTFGSLAGPGGATLSGLFDGIGVDGTVPTAPGSVRVYEAGVDWTARIRDRALHVMFGKLDPRKYFATNKFADDENTQFLNNLFDDPPALSWPTTAAGPTIYGLQLWTSFGARDQYRFDVGWYNTPGQFFNKGIVFFQISWRAELQGREINVRGYGQIDDRANRMSAGAGVSIDWWATDRIGVFARATVRDNIQVKHGEINHVESDWQLGAAYYGPIPTRPDDVLGIAWGLIKGPVRVAIPGGAPENHEMVIEVYYRFLLDEGGLEISPLAQFILDPGAGTFGEPDFLAILGLRIHVAF